jgi:hypothetical protein
MYNSSLDGRFACLMKLKSKFDLLDMYICILMMSDSKSIRNSKQSSTRIRAETRRRAEATGFVECA